MLYRIQSATTIEIGGWPQFFVSVFQLNAKNEAEARYKAETELKKVNAKFDNTKIECIGKEYSVSSNNTVSVAGIKYRKDTINRIKILNGSMQIIIFCNRNGKEDYDNIGVWCRPNDFKNAVDCLFSKLTFNEI